jgi:quinol-cytochrome oxidoreductase complex cytochrome b subunit
MLLWHVLLLPVTVGLLIVGHVLLVRRHGVVPPFDADPDQLPGAGRSLDTKTAPVTVPAPTPSSEGRGPLTGPRGGQS